MDIGLFDYSLPPDLVAQFPTRSREQSRLMVLDRSSNSIEHVRFKSIVEYFRKGDALVVNNTRVFKARLFGYRPTGGRVELLLVRRVEPGRELWSALVTPSRRVKEGEKISFDDKRSVTLERDAGGGYWHVLFPSGSAREKIIASFGHVPLPPYISRDDQPSDIRRYQTIFAAKDRTGAVAAPTAGFHFTQALLRQLRERGVAIVELTLHVGPGTFKPIKTDDIEQHVVDSEVAELTPESAATLNRVRDKGGSVFAVGTTSVRTLESAPMVDGIIQPVAGMVDLYIRPGFKYRVVDHLITNFHLPKSSLLVLVSAFAGRERILNAYHDAIRERYRFYSYGDAMLIL
jgi:S-adenosylmethionine:tRNA ribosyltransferase-isomerase